MKKITTGIVLLRKREEVILDDTVRYELLRIELSHCHIYAITVQNSYESEESFIGKNKSEAISFYNMICKNRVTPCTFLDIIDDFRYKIQ